MIREIEYPFNPLPNGDALADALLAARWPSLDALEALASPSPSADVTSRHIEPLTEYEACEAAAVFHNRHKVDDPYALARAIEHVLRMRAEPSLDASRRREAVREALMKLALTWKGWHVPIVYSRDVCDDIQAYRD